MCDTTSTLRHWAVVAWRLYTVGLTADRRIGQRIAAVVFHEELLRTRDGSNEQAACAAGAVCAGRDRQPLAESVPQAARHDGFGQASGKYAFARTTDLGSAVDLADPR